MERIPDGDRELDDELQRLDAYWWHAASYLAVGQIHPHAVASSPLTGATPGGSEMSVKRIVGLVQGPPLDGVANSSRSLLSRGVPAADSRR
jgi:hypothetical protein